MKESPRCTKAYISHKIYRCVYFCHFPFLKLCHDAIRNKSEILTIWQNVRIVFKSIIVVQVLLNIEWCHFALNCTLKVYVGGYGNR